MSCHSVVEVRDGRWKMGMLGLLLCRAIGPRRESLNQSANRSCCVLRHYVADGCVPPQPLDRNFEPESHA
jgi:hypothetical protein